MKGYELIKAITERKLKNNTTIKVKMGNAYKATLKYENLMLKWESGDFDTSILCSTEADFEVIEENKEIDIQSIKEISSEDRFYRLEINERDINDAIKRAREYMDKERECE